MRVLHISSHDISGGAARAAFRLHKGLQASGIESSMLVQDKLSSDDTVIGPNSNVAQGIAHFRTAVDHIPKLFYRNRKPTTYHLQWLPDSLMRKIRSLKPHIVHLHWICRGFVNVKTLARIKQPIVWTLHDMWPFTGGCHYVEECERYKQICGKCPQIGSNRQKDLAWWTWQRKAKYWHDLNLQIVSPSKWIKRHAQQSTLFKTVPNEVIPYGLNQAQFRPMDRSNVRQLLGLPQNKNLIVFGAINATIDHRKGFDYFLPALRKFPVLKDDKQTEIVVFGASKPNAFDDSGLKINYLGRLHDELSLSLVYMASDVFVAPSREDNLPNTIIEALACGVPCVAFKVGGIPEMIEHNISGYLAEPYDSADLARGIAWVVENKQRWENLSKAARKKAEDEYDIDMVAKRYVDLYKSVLHNSNTGKTKI